MSDSGLGILFQIATVVALVLTNGFFVAAEFSLVTVRRTRIEEMVNSGNSGARRVAYILKDLDTVISSTQLGITMASLALGWVGEPFVAHQIESVLSFLPPAIIAPTAHTIAAVVAFVTITYLHIVLGELAPKSLAMQRAEATAIAVSGPIILFSRVFHVFIHILNRSGSFFLRLLHVSAPSRGQLVHSEEELRLLLDESQEGGVLEQRETEIIQRVFDFTDMTARQVMVPRTDMICLQVDSQLSDVLETVLHNGFTRYPVYNANLDDIVGIVQVKDLLPALCGQADTFDLRGILRSPLVVPEMINAQDLLNQFRRHHTHLAVLVDEFGGTAGLVTMQDLLEVIIGEVSEGFAEDEIQIEPQPDGSALVNGKVLLASVNERFELELEDPHYVTLGGFVFKQIGRLPRVGDEVTVFGARLRVERLDGLRVALVRLTKLDSEQAQAQDE